MVKEKGLDEAVADRIGEFVTSHGIKKVNSGELSLAVLLLVLNLELRFSSLFCLFGEQLQERLA